MNGEYGVGSQLHEETSIDMNDRNVYIRLDILISWCSITMLVRKFVENIASLVTQLSKGTTITSAKILSSRGYEILKASAHTYHTIM